MGKPAGGLPAGRVALLFTDIQGSTALLHALGPAYGDVLDAHDRILRDVWDEFDGVEFGNEGDAFCVAFIDHDRAVAAVTAAQRRLASADWPADAQVRVRMGLHSGEPTIRGADYWGVDVHYAARLAAAAHGGQVLISAEMRSRVPDAVTESLGAHGLRDFPAPRDVFHLVVDGTTAAAFPPPRTLAATRSTLPSVATPIVGRENVVADLAACLAGDQRLVTVVGPGGVGKTRTAVAVGEALADVLPDGVAFVPLAALHSAEDVPVAIVEALRAAVPVGSDPATVARSMLRDLGVLVVLDNADHLRDLPGLVAGLIDHAPRSRWLVTSQAPLGIRAETVVRLDPLEVPRAGSPWPDVESTPAAALFLELLRRRAPGTGIAESERHLMPRLCALLDGMPLALELAAARAPVLGLARLVDAIAAEPLGALGTGPGDLPERQRGLRAVLTWTTGLLDARERDVFVAGAAFAQAWSVENLERMMAGALRADEVWDAVSRLLDLSLVVQRGDGRLTMPDRVRRHALELLAASGREASVRSRHAAVVCEDVLRLLVDSVCQFGRADASLDELTEEVLHALDWTSTHDQATFRSLLATARCPLHTRGKLAPFVDRMQAFARADGPDDRERGVFLMSLSTPIAGHGVSLEEKVTALTAAEACLAEHGLTDDLMNLVSAAAELRVAQGDHDRAHAELDRGVVAAYDADRSDWAQSLEDQRVLVDMAAGDLGAAEARLHAMYERSERDTSISRGAATYLGDCAFTRGDFAAAARWYADYLRTVAPSHAEDVVFQVYGIAAACAALGLDQTAAELSAAVVVAYETRSGRPWSDIADDEYDEFLAGARGRTDELPWARASARGRALGFEQMIARAREVADGLPVDAGPPRVDEPAD